VWEFTIWNQRLETSPKLYASSPPYSIFSPPHISLFSYLCDWSHSSWHASPSIDKDSSSRHCISFHGDCSLCLSWSDLCFVCPLSLHRHSTRGSFCACPLANCFFHSPSSSCSFFFSLSSWLIRETSTSLNIGKTERSPLPLLSLVSDIVFYRTIFPQV
jgi:hypothetical protein